MAWSDTWADILNGGSPRWKVDDMNSKKIALDYIYSTRGIGGYAITIW